METQLLAPEVKVNGSHEQSCKKTKDKTVLWERGCQQAGTVACSLAPDFQVTGSTSNGAEGRKEDKKKVAAASCGKEKRKGWGRGVGVEVHANLPRVNLHIVRGNAGSFFVSGPSPMHVERPAKLKLSVDRA